jgi:hypothetical protein
VQLKKKKKQYKNQVNKFHNYIFKIKENISMDLFNIINPTLIKNPYESYFPQNFFFNKKKNKNKVFLFLKNIIYFYVKNLYLLFSYFIEFVLFSFYFNKKRKKKVKVILDIFGIVDKINKDRQLKESYLTGVYKVFQKYKKNYTILLRPYYSRKNPFKLKNFFQIINKDKRDFIFEYEFLKLSNFLTLFIIIIIYPFKIFRLQQLERNNIDLIFNVSLIEDLKYFSFNSITRHLLGKNLSQMRSIQKIYSWCELQAIERSFNYAIRKHCNHIEIIGMQFFINYKNYYNAFADDLDYRKLITPHKILVNGRYFVRETKIIKYKLGVSLRYKNLFHYKKFKKGKYILLLGSYDISLTKLLLASVKSDRNIIFKSHPAIDIKKLGNLPRNIILSERSIYELFKEAKIVISSASGTLIEAVACGLPVLVLTSQNNISANPLIYKGRGKVWDEITHCNDINKKCKNLIKYKINNKIEFKNISNWYKKNFFVIPSEKNIIKVFELGN